MAHTGQLAGAGVSAILAATARALATRAGLIADPFAETLVSAAGVEFFTAVASGERALSDLGDDNGFALLTDLFAVRTRFFDDVLSDACRAGIRQTVILGSGLDSRSYRMWWPAATTVFEIDRPPVIDFISQTMRALDVAPLTNRRAVGVDLRRDWPEALRRIGFDQRRPTVWIAEGLLIGFLSPTTQERVLDSLTALSAPGSRVAADYLPAQQPSLPSQEHALAERWRQFGFTDSLDELTYPSDHRDPAEFLTALGWRTTATGLGELFTATGLPGLRRQDLNTAPVAGRYVRALLP